MKTIIVSGAIANRYPYGGAAWGRLEWILGFKALGLRVYFVEQIARDTCVDEAGQRTSFVHSANRAFFEKISPIHHVDKIQCPMMVIHGANDPRVPVAEAEQIVAALKKRNVPVVYLRYEDEGHGLVKLKNRLDAYPKMAEFLDKYLK